MTINEFAEIIKARRKYEGMTLESLSKATRLSKSAIHRWETSEAVISREAFAKLKVVLGLKMKFNDLYHGHSNNDPKPVPVFDTAYDHIKQWRDRWKESVNESGDYGVLNALITEFDVLFGKYDDQLKLIRSNRSE